MHHWHKFYSYIQTVIFADCFMSGKLKNYLFFAMMIPTVSLILHNFIPHEHHSGCPDNEQSKIETTEDIHSCCHHQSEKENHSKSKSSCVITSLPPAWFTFVKYFILSAILHIDVALELYTIYSNSVFTDIISTVLLKIPFLRGPPVLLV